MSASSACRPPISFSTIQLSHRLRRRPSQLPAGFHPKCEASAPAPPDPAAARPASQTAGKSTAAGLQVGSPVIVVEAPATLKTATAMPCLRVNDGLVKPGDVGRIVARKPKDVWAVRLAIGTYLIDGKHFQPLDLGEEEETS
ncbi:hypothetical protein Taro_006973 [Colocasia esculenta]|uniref:Chlororespiratory reduction 42 n=1 Tax=Colocasia esculenta TaxID=4460 RepID=A0A843TYY0_COLES|nr:hypothetical protein [Colocasia esculenta]